jgi:hypothetical protein
MTAIVKHILRTMAVANTHLYLARKLIEDNAFQAWAVSQNASSIQNQLNEAASIAHPNEEQEALVYGLICAAYLRADRNLLRLGESLSQSAYPWAKDISAALRNALPQVLIQDFQVDSPKPALITPNSTRSADTFEDLEA